MPVQAGQIVKNLNPAEPVTITRVQPLGNMVSVSYTGVNSSKASSRVLSKADFEALEVLAEEGSFNFEGDPARFTLFAEAERINSAYQFDPLFAVNCSIVDPLPHQVEAVYKFLLPQPRIRFLLADDTGAGKTIMTGLLIKELIMRGLIERVLVITPGGLTKQWQEDEMAVKFNLHFQLVNRSMFASDPNVFHSASRIVTSIDFISRDDVLNVASNSHWDLVVFDESHKLSAYDYGSKQYLSRRYRAAQVFSRQSEHLLLLTATPHRGRKDTFKKLLQLLDEDVFATDAIAAERVKKLEKDGSNKFFIRRLKEDMRDWQEQPLYRERFTKTVAYSLTPEEKKLYDAVTRYLTRRKEEASQTRNVHVSLALTVMQRRLASSIAAIKNTLEKRWLALQGIVDEVSKNPALWNQRHKLEGFDVDSLEDFDEMEDEDREAIENILSDPRKFKLFTTASSLQEIQQEAREVKQLFEMAASLFNRKQAEAKFLRLQDLLRENGVLDNQAEKLVIFTEHKDTLFYLQDRLAKSNGYGVATIHGGKSVDERREAQRRFASPDAQILIATDAAGEGINLQFCRLLINWDIPWNPNRLEQRMGRIHRYGQKQNVLVLNMVAGNTREGAVLQRLLTKLDSIRESIGDDRVYDVIQDVLQNVRMDDIVDAVLNGQQNTFTEMLQQDEGQLEGSFRKQIHESRESLSLSPVNYREARRLKEHSDEKRLQPVYVRLFFEKAFARLGGRFSEIRRAIYQIDYLPPVLSEALRKQYNIVADNLRGIQFCFDKQVFLDYSLLQDLGKVHYINPGNPLFDSVVEVTRQQCREDMLRGTVLVSPEDREPFFAWFVKSQLVDNRPGKKGDSIADERLVMVQETAGQQFSGTSPARFIDLRPPLEFARTAAPPGSASSDQVTAWAFEKITMPQYEETRQRVAADTARRKEYVETAFTQVIADLQLEIQELQTRLLRGETRHQEKIQARHRRIDELLQKKAQRMATFELMNQLSPKVPEVLGCAWVVPLTEVEYQGHFGMSRDQEAEAIAMQTAMGHENARGWYPEDVSAANEGYDIRSMSPEGLKCYIEVKGRNGADGSVMLSENEMNRLGQLGEQAWLYIVLNCKTAPELFRIQDPARSLKFERHEKGVQYFLPGAEWRQKVRQ